MIAFDKHLNFVLADTQEIRKININNNTAQQQQQQPMERRTLGLLILRGDVIVSMSVEAPPPAAPIASEKVWNID